MYTYLRTVINGENCITYIKYIFSRKYIILISNYVYIHIN